MSSIIKKTSCTDDRRARLIAFYLPQYHPIPGNDKWWGKGFTEWTNVAKAKPLFRGHHQPHLPADLGFYDLRLPEVREAQAELARSAGIEGFCYWHYWFGANKRLLERPFNEVLASKRPDFPFCLAWANENWTRSWDGGEKEILVRQSYSDPDYKEHLTWLATVFKDRRYIRVNGKPLFLIYRPQYLPETKKFATIFKETARLLGIGEIYLVGTESGMMGEGECYDTGYDRVLRFSPDWSLLPRAFTRRIRKIDWQHGGRVRLLDHCLYDYERLMKHYFDVVACGRDFPTVLVSWDNSPRRKDRALIIEGSTPCGYKKWLKKAVQHVRPFERDEQIVFINAWNEWAEGNYLEPDDAWGMAYLKSTQEAVGRK